MSRDKHKVLVTRRMPPNVTARVAADYDATLNPDDRVLEGDALLAATAGQDALLVCSTERFDADVVARLPDRVRVIATFSVGYEHIDVAAARARGIVVTNTPDVLTESTADIAMLCLLGAARRAAEGDRCVREDRWTGWHATMLLGVHLGGKRLGILGMGRIGRALARRAAGFGMEIHYHNRRPLPADLADGAIYHETPEDLLRVSQFFSINAPSTPDTLRFLNAERIALLPPGAVVANSARGNMVDDQALIAALRSGHVAAAGLDVFDGEPNVHPGYRALENTFLLPHLGSATHETRDAMGFCCLDNLDAFFAGRPCPNALG